MGNNQPIAVFDSGCGGLTALNTLRKLLPGERFIYLGDTARLPYGEKDVETIRLYARQIASYFEKQDVKAALAACGTMSSNVPDFQNYFSVPYFNVIDSTARAAAASTRNHQIGLVATKATIESGAFSRAIERESGYAPIAVPAPTLASLIEAGYRADSKEIQNSIKEYAPRLIEANIDTLVLGCTHYPLVKDAFLDILGNQIQIISCGEEAAKDMARYLQSHHLVSSGIGAVRYLFTKSPEEEAELAQALMEGESILPYSEWLPPKMLEDYR